ncbi:DUF1822 family protein [Nostoc sp. 'Peltigera membranacea cyanobiont' N6]|uniref:DUF1822 family protein n=1 Tax=Nostoc sp. 'Peltigera membranacea cyanobiont' N6 TaxID=1261031 RepID=UPI000CF3261F|nr:DUF1822 family protein [Nostoc sp. 'Peltigera membranacea cyanobiont' N6]AVH63570.1 protein of unknown function DUF1822 [Nostoc sp. 'Peltigera membranacea cyanobiont' N6]MBX9252963.1 DUF1822 family protein [Desmonostoc muscorum CCALA 125]
MNSNQLAFTIPISREMINIADKLSQQQRNEQKTRKVYLNTLALLAVEFFCQCMEIETEFSKSYGLDSVVLSLMNTASIFIKDKGLLECRPVLPKEEFSDIPPEILSERIGYMVVEIDEIDRQARILGFVESVTNEKLPLTKLSSLQDFLVYLQKLQKVENDAKSTAKIPVNPINESIVKLSKWFEGLLDSGWQSELAIARDIPNVLAVTKDISPVNVTDKEEVGGARIIHLMYLSEPVLLILRQTRLSPDEIEIILRLYPASESIFLLDGIKMTLLDEKDNPIRQLEKQAKGSNWLQLRFKGNVGDEFSLKISFREDSVITKFII